MIKARIKAENSKANIGSYKETYRSFSWDDIYKEFTWHETGLVNIAYEAVDRWAEDPEKADKDALVFEKGPERVAFTYSELKEQSAVWAGLLSDKGFKQGDRLLIFLVPCPEIYLAILACARLGVIFCPLYSSMGFDELEDRISNADPLGILTQPDLAENLPTEVMGNVRHTLYTQGPLPGLFNGEALVSDGLREVRGGGDIKWLSLDSPLYLIHTSGSTGPPKGVLHCHGDMSSHLISARYALDVTQDTVLWTDGNPAWITGTVYSTFAPWLCCATSVVQGAPFTASNWYRTLETSRVTVWYTTPMTVGKLMEAGEDLPTRYDCSNLKHIATVGEALVPELFYWLKKNLKHSPHDTWWMSESGSICISNFPSMDIKPGSMGRPLPGIEADILDEEGNRLPLLTMGQLALKTPWPSLMKTIWREDLRYQAYFTKTGWFLTGDMALKDEQGYFYHQGRMDDLIKVGDKLLGPYEIEHILCQHPSVLEAAVISKSAEQSSPHLKAFITLQRGNVPSSRMSQEIKAFVKANLSPDTPLKEIEFCERLPKTNAGKLLRRVLRARELGLPGGDPTLMKG